MKFFFFVLAILFAGCVQKTQELSLAPIKRIDARLYDTSRKREVPIAIYLNEEGVTKTKKRMPVTVLSHGYGAKHTEYAFLANFLASMGHCVVSIQHDLANDPPLPRAGNLYQMRMPFWERGIENILFILETIKQKHLKNDLPELDVEKVTLIGHSNGGDLSMMFGTRYPERIHKVITLDSLRHPFPMGVHILSLRASDTVADPGVIPNSKTSRVIQMKNTKHNDMYDKGPEETKCQILSYLGDNLKD